MKTIKFSNRCRSILADENYVVAVSEGGVIKVLDLNRKNLEPLTFRIDGKVFAEPTIYNGTLFVASLVNPIQEQGAVYALPMGKLSGEQSEMDVYWRCYLKGRPNHALLAFGDRLYLNVGIENGDRGIYVIDNIIKKKPGTPKMVYAGPQCSALAADNPTQKVAFLSSEKVCVSINVFDHLTETFPDMIVNNVKGASGELLSHIPIAMLGKKMFAVFGKDKKQLCRIDISNYNFDTIVADRVRNFAIAGMNREIVLNSSGILSTFDNTHESLLQGEIVTSGPLVLRDRAVVVGLRNGKIRFYKLNNLSVQNEFQVFRANEKIVSLALFKDMVVVGNQLGDVKLFRLMSL